MAAVISALAGCGGGSTANVQNPPAPALSKVSISFQSAPAGSIPVGATTTFTAIVGNDPTLAGVDWSLTCQNTGNCGSLSALHTASGQATTYTSPSSFSGNSQTVDVVAFATADHTLNVAAPITVTAFGSVLKGNYVLQAQGVDSSLGPYQFAAVIVLDGNGGITSGEQTANFFDQNPDIEASVSRSDPIAGGSYFLGPDGRGTITLTTSDLDVGVNGIETFSFVSLSTSQALIAETDFTESATGTMDLQTNTVPPSGGYAFVVSGTDIASQSPTAFGGVFNIDSPSTISGKGSVSDQNLAGTVTTRQTLSGTLSEPDSFGAVTIGLTAGFAAAPIQFTGYIVDATHMKLIESDNSTGAGSGSTGGVAIGQGSATGTFIDDTSFSGTYVFGILGEDLDTFEPSSMTSVGVFSVDGSGNVANGFTDTFLQGNSVQGTGGARISAQFGGTYSVDTKGTGRVRVVFNHFVPVVNPGFQPLFFYYLTGNGNPPLILDGSDTSGNIDYPSLGAGVAYPQSTASLTFGGKYGFSITQQNGSENDGTGQITGDPTADTLTGVVDTNSSFNPTFSNSFSGAFAVPASNGRFAGTLDSQAFDFSPFAADFYIIDPNRGFFVETDLVDPNAPSSVVSFGYYAGRTPVCSTCQ
jgi:hypothetical protein